MTDELIKRIFAALDSINPGHDKIAVQKYLDDLTEKRLSETAQDLEEMCE